MAFTAMVLSLCALLVSVLEVSSIRREQRVGVWPYVDVSSRYNAEGFSISATNKGIGPARVRTVALKLDGKPVADLDTMILDVLGPEEAFSYDVYTTSNPAGNVLSPDEAANLFSVPWTNATRRLVEDMVGEFSIEVCYCSVYDDCWLAELNAGDPAEISTCD